MSKFRGDRQVNEKIRLANSFGYELKRTKKHLVFYHPNGSQVVSPRTTRDTRDIKNFISQLKRGIKFKKVS